MTTTPTPTELGQSQPPPCRPALPVPVNPSETYAADIAASLRYLCEVAHRAEVGAEQLGETARPILAAVAGLRPIRKAMGTD